MRKVVALLGLLLTTCLAWSQDDIYDVIIADNLGDDLGASSEDLKAMSSSIIFYNDEVKENSGTQFGAGNEIYMSAPRLNGDILWPTLVDGNNNPIEVIGDYQGFVKFTMPASSVTVTNVQKMVPLSGPFITIKPGSGCITEESNGFALPGATIKFYFNSEYSEASAVAEIIIDNDEENVSSLHSSEYEESKGFVFEYEVPESGSQFDITPTARYEVILAGSLPSGLRVNFEKQYGGVFQYDKTWEVWYAECSPNGAYVSFANIGDDSNPFEGCYVFFDSPNYQSKEHAIMFPATTSDVSTTIYKSGIFYFPSLDEVQSIQCPGNMVIDNAYKISESGWNDYAHFYVTRLNDQFKIHPVDEPSDPGVYMGVALTFNDDHEETDRELLYRFEPDENGECSFSFTEKDSRSIEWNYYENVTTDGWLCYLGDKGIIINGLYYMGEGGEITVPSKINDQNVSGFELSYGLNLDKITSLDFSNCDCNGYVNAGPGSTLSNLEHIKLKYFEQIVVEWDEGESGAELPDDFVQLDEVEVGDGTYVLGRVSYYDEEKEETIYEMVAMMIASKDSQKWTLADKVTINDVEYRVAAIKYPYSEETPENVIVDITGKDFSSTKPFEDKGSSWGKPSTVYCDQSCIEYFQELLDSEYYEIYSTAEVNGCKLLLSGDSEVGESSITYYDCKLLGFTEEAYQNTDEEENVFVNVSNPILSYDEKAGISNYYEITSVGALADSKITHLTLGMGSDFYYEGLDLSKMTALKGVYFASGNYHYSDNDQNIGYGIKSDVSVFIPNYTGKGANVYPSSVSGFKEAEGEWYFIIDDTYGMMTATANGLSVDSRAAVVPTSVNYHGWPITVNMLSGIHYQPTYGTDGGVKLNKLTMNSIASEGSSYKTLVECDGSLLYNKEKEENYNVALYLPDVEKDYVSRNLGEFTNSVGLRTLVISASTVIAPEETREAFIGIGVNNFCAFETVNNDEGSYDEETNTLQVVVNERTKVADIANLVNSGTAIAENIIITLDEDLQLDSESASTWSQIGTDENPFSGTFDGNGNTIISLGEDAQNTVASLFGTIAADGSVKNLTVGKASVDEKENTVNSDIHIEVSAASNVTEKVTGENGEERTVSYYGVLAQENNGTISSVVFVGDFGFDESINSDNVVVSLVADNKEDAVIDHCVAYFTNLGDAEVESSEGNKRKIIVMQNVGTGRNAGRVMKTASNGKRKASTKSVTPGSAPHFSDEDINLDYRIYSDDEMATGEPAYWMNMSGSGYEGEFHGDWTMSIDGKFPVNVTDKNKAIVKLVYEIEGLEEEELSALNLDGASFARLGSEVKISYGSKPVQITGGTSTIDETSATVILPEDSDDGIVTITLKYEGQKTAIKAVDEELSITVNGGNIVLSNILGHEVTVTDVMGRQVYSKKAGAESLTLRLPSAGIYLVKVGEEVRKVIVR